MVEIYQLVVLCQTVVDKVRLDCLKKVPIENCIYEQVEDLFGAIPVVVDDAVSIDVLVHSTTIGYHAHDI